MAWMLQPHNYAQVRRPNLYNVDYRRVGAYKGMGGMGMGQACDPATDPLCGLSPDWYTQLVGPTGPNFTQTPTQMLQAAQVQAQLNPASLPTGQQAAAGISQAQMSAALTQYLPWIAGGVVLLLLMRRR